MIPVRDQGQNDYNELFAGEKNMCHCDLPCYLENVFSWNFCNSYSLIAKGIKKYEQISGEFNKIFMEQQF